jgi:hypothetical protein
LNGYAKIFCGGNFRAVKREVVLAFAGSFDLEITQTGI